MTALTNDIELRLIGSSAPDGEIALKDLAAIGSALQELVTRIGRDVANTPGPGRTKRFMEELTEVRLQALEAGSTLLRFSKGPTDQLDLSLSEQDLVDDRFWEVAEGIRSDERPMWATDLIAESAGKLAAALCDAAPRSLFSNSRRGQVEIQSADVHLGTWATKIVRTETQMTAKGRLEKVDLRTHEFRVRDDVGHAVDLKHVVGDAVVAPLVGQWVVVTGEVVGSSSRLTLDNVTVERLADPAAELTSDPVPTLQELLDSTPGPDPNGGIDLSDEDLVALLQAARG